MSDFGIDQIVTDVYNERMRQERLRAEGKFAWTCAAPNVSYDRKMSVLSEEIGELAREVVEHGITKDKYSADVSLGKMPPHREDYFKKRMRDELVQIAAVAIAWIESLDATSHHD